MRINAPITEMEYELGDFVLIQSETDLLGTITTVNDSFAEISGYPADELIGQPHNIIRHPDMPQIVFGDLWRTIKAGLLWDGYIKNRRKNGDFYWVRSQVVPRRKNGRIVGYLSSRWRTTREKIAEFDAFYARLRNGDPGAKIVRGEPVEVVGMRRLISRLF